MNSFLSHQDKLLYFRAVSYRIPDGIYLYIHCGETLKHAHRLILLVLSLCYCLKILKLSY